MILVCGLLQRNHLLDGCYFRLSLVEAPQALGAMPSVAMHAATIAHLAYVRMTSQSF